MKNPVSNNTEIRDNSYFGLQKREKNEHNLSELIGEDSMKGMIADITFAATETTTTALAL